MVWTDSTPGYEVFQAGQLIFITATLSLLVAMAGLHKRHGGLGSLGWAGMLSVLFVVQLSLASGSPMTFQGWGFYITIGTALFGFGLYRRALMPRLDVAAFSCGELIGIAIWMTLRMLAGPHREWGGLLAQHWISNLPAVTIGVLILAIGTFRLGMWLRREQPADILGHVQTVVT